MTEWLRGGGYSGVLTLHGLLLLGLTVGCGAQLFRSWTRRHWVGFGAVALGVLVLQGASPARPAVYYDEFFYLATARNLARHGPVEPLLWEGIPPQARPVGRFVPPYPQGWPWLLHLVPASPETSPWRQAVAVSRLLAFSTALLFYGILTRRFTPLFATAGALCLAALPPALKLSGSAAAGTASLFFLTLALAALVVFSERPVPAHLGWLVAAVAFAAEIRPENGLYGLLLGTAAWPAARRLSPGVRRGALALGLVLLAAPAAVLAGGAADPEGAHHFQATPRPGFTPWGNRLANLGNNVLFFAEDRAWPLPLTLLAALGARAGRERLPAGFLLGWIGGSTLLLSYFPFGDFRAAHSFDTWRFSLHVALPALSLATAGMEALWRRPGWWWQVTAVLLVALCLLTPLTHRAFLYQPHPLEEVWVAAGEISESRIVAAEVPELFCLLHYGRGQASALPPIRGSEPFYLLAVGEPDRRLWRGKRLDPVRVWPGLRRQLLLLEVRPSP